MRALHTLASLLRSQLTCNLYRVFTSFSPVCVCVCVLCGVDECVTLATERVVRALSVLVTACMMCVAAVP